MNSGIMNKKYRHRTFKTLIINFGVACLDLLFPVSCPGCDKPLLTSAFPVCPSCTFNLERVSSSVAKTSICKLPQACDAFSFIFSLWMFDKAGTVQHIHQHLKYKNRPHYGLTLGKLMGTTFLLPLHPLSQPDLIVPIPLHRRRLFERGYNQSSLLARGMSKVSGIKSANDVLIRSAYTQTQTGLDNHERLANVLHTFSVQKADLIYDKHILLVDDVLTTGATLLAASMPLKEAGAREVSVATLAMARP